MPRRTTAHPPPAAAPAAVCSPSRAVLRAALVLLLLAGLALGLGVLFAYDPADTSCFPRCVVHQLTGLKCPGCGFQRAIHQLLHGHLAASFAYCPYAYFTGLVLLLLWLFPGFTRRPAFGWTVALASLLYTLCRNLVDGL